VLVYDLSLLQKVLHTGIDGIIGIDVLGRIPFAIDYAARELGLFSPTKASASEHVVNYSLAGRFPTVEVSLDGTRLRLMVDTSAAALTLFSSQVAGRTARLATGEAKHSTKLSGEFYGSELAIQHSILGGVDFGKRPSFVVATREDAVADFDGLLSPSGLGISRLTFDPTRGLISFRFQDALQRSF
jgi:hypothetical protein